MDIAYEKTYKQGRDKFFIRVANAIKKPKSHKHFVFLDKNHPPSAIPGTMKSIKESIPNNYEVKIVALTPKTEPE